MSKHTGNGRPRELTPHLIQSIYDAMQATIDATDCTFSEAADLVAACCADPKHGADVADHLAAAGFDGQAISQILTDLYCEGEVAPVPPLPTR